MVQIFENIIKGFIVQYFSSGIEIMEPGGSQCFTVRQDRMDDLKCVSLDPLNIVAQMWQAVVENWRSILQD